MFATNVVKDMVNLWEIGLLNIVRLRDGPPFKYKKRKEYLDYHDACANGGFALAYGGTDEEINHQLISSKENLAKSTLV